MTDELKSWIEKNHTMLYFFAAQTIAILTGAAYLLIYATRLEERVSTMETRGAAYTVARMDEMRVRISILEEKIDKNTESINRVVEVMTKNLSVNPMPGGQR